MKTDPRMTNQEIARILLEMSALCDMHGQEFKQRAYHWAAADVSIFPESLADVYQREGVKGLARVPSVGAGIAKHIEELLTTGRFREYEKLKKDFPVNISELLLIEGIGPKTIRELWRRLRVTNVVELERACRQGRVRALPRFGSKSEERILRSIEALKSSES